MNGRADIACQYFHTNETFKLKNKNYTLQQPTYLNVFSYCTFYAEVGSIANYNHIF